jgi:hypothetical protein
MLGRLPRTPGRVIEWSNWWKMGGNPRAAFCNLSMTRRNFFAIQAYILLDLEAVCNMGRNENLQDLPPGLRG